jgi:hypothetical protein
MEAGVIRPDPVLATTVHPLQVVDESCPKPSTTSGWTHRHLRRGHLVHRAALAPGVLWEHLDQAKITEVPALAALAAWR